MTNLSKPAILLSSMNSLQKRVGLASILSLLLFGIFILIYSFYKERDYLFSSIHSEIKKSASFLVPQAYLLLKRGDSSSLLDYTQVVQSIVTKGNFCFVEIVDAQGNIRVPLDLMGRPSHARSLRNGPWGSLAMGQDFLIHEEKYEDIGSVIEGLFGIVERDRILGYVVLGVSTRPVYQSLWRSTWTTAAFLLVLLFIAAYSSWKFAQHATSPVLHLARSVESYNESEDLEKFNISGPREVEVLASKIKKAFATIKNNKDEMKRTVTSKTETLVKTQQELKTVLDGFRRLSKSIRIEEATKVICDITRSIVYCNIASVILTVSDDGKEIVPFDHTNGALEKSNFLIHPKPLGSKEKDLVSTELLFQVLNKGEIEIVPNVKLSSYHDKILPAVQSCAMVPLISVEGKPFGILFLGMTGDAPFEESELQLLHKLMEPIGMALDNVFLYSQVEKLATCDSMTGVLNHQNIRERLMESIKMAKRQESSVYVITADIDKFKTFNDTYGHSAGDKVIKSFAKILSASRRVGEYVGRPGGEEFLLVLGSTNLEGASAAAERLMNAIRSSQISIDNHQKVSFRVSMGIAGYPDDGQTMDELLDKADRALYVAKSRGRDRYIVWREEIDSEFKDLRIS